MDLTSQLVGPVAGLAITLIAAVVLWNTLNKNQARELAEVKSSLLKCETQHEEANKKILEIVGDHRELRGRVDVMQKHNEILEKLNLTLNHFINGKGG